MEQSQLLALTCPKPLHSSNERKYVSILFEGLCFEEAMLRQLGLYPKFSTLAIFSLDQVLTEGGTC